METVITINIAEWILFLVVILMGFGLADITLSLYSRYLQYKIDKKKNNSRK